MTNGGRALTRLEGLTVLSTLIKLRIPLSSNRAVRLREISFVVERETAQTAN